MNSTFPRECFWWSEDCFDENKGIKCSLNDKQFLAEIIDDNMVSNGEEKSTTSASDTEIDEDKT